MLQPERMEPELPMLHVRQKPQELKQQEPELPQGLERQKLKKKEPQMLQEPSAEAERQAWPSGSSDASRQILYEDAD